jgi:hypothetical protein
LAAPLRAQDTTAVAPHPAGPVAGPVDTARADSMRPGRKPPIGPTGALIRSLLVPGLGQIWLGRKLTAGFFVAAEATTLTLALRANRQAHQLDGVDDAKAADKRQQREDFFVLMAVNHVLSGLEAYVSSHLYDFPADVKLTYLPGGVAAQVSLPFRLR